MTVASVRRASLSPSLSLTPTTTASCSGPRLKHTSKPTPLMTNFTMEPTVADDPVHMLVIPTNVATSKITNINLYTDQAQITRSYKFQLASGTTKLVIEGLPSVMDRESIRVEGRGNALIQGVSAFKTPLEDVPEPSSTLLEDLKDRKTVALGALARYKKAVSTIDRYMDTVDIEHLDISKLGEAMDVYDTTEEKWEDKMRAVQAEVIRMDVEIGEEKERLAHGESKAMKKLRTKVEVGLFRAELGEDELEIVLVYAVSSASWEAGYDIRVDMEASNAPVKVIYKAAINQRTGEAWTNVPITLETAQPTFGFEVPSLSPWNISLRDPLSSVRTGGRTKQTARRSTGGKAPRRQMAVQEESDEDEDEDEEYDMQVEIAAVTSKGKVNATFRVPGLVSVPSDEEEHGVVIASLELEARVVWGCVPKGGKQANITNSSEYTFLSGPGNVYVDRSFISRSDVPSVSPKEEFKIALGVDPSIRVTYHPREKSIANSGFYNKTLRHTFTQRISIHNSKSIAIEGLRITDQIPVSQDATNLNVTLISPALALPDPGSVSGPADTAKVKANMPTVKVGEGVIAMWHGTNEVGQGKDLGALGKDGKIDWVCALPAFGRLNLVLKWEVVAGVKEEIFGL